MKFLKTVHKSTWMSHYIGKDSEVCIPVDALLSCEATYCIVEMTQIDFQLSFSFLVFYLPLFPLFLCNWPWKTCHACHPQHEHGNAFLVSYKHFFQVLFMFFAYYVFHYLKFVTFRFDIVSLHPHAEEDETGIKRAAESS